MPANAMCFCFLKRDVASHFANHVVSVIALRSEEQMLRVDASRRVALVADGHAVGDWAIECDVRCAVCKLRLHAAVRHFPVSVGVRIRRPKPASRFRDWDTLPQDHVAQWTIGSLVNTCRHAIPFIRPALRVALSATLRPRFRRVKRLSCRRELSLAPATIRAYVQGATFGAR